MISPPSLQASIVSRETDLAMPIGRKNPGPAARTVEEWVIWTYQTQQAHKVDDRFAHLGQPMGHASRCSVSRVAEAAALGAIIAGSGMSSALHHDAELVHDLVKGKGFDALERGLIIYFGETGEAPDWKPGARVKYGPVLKDNGKPKMLLDRNDHVIGCEVRQDVTQRDIDYARHVYWRWWMAMEKLGEMMRLNGLASCSGRATTEKPWLKDGDALTHQAT